VIDPAPDCGSGTAHYWLASVTGCELTGTTRTGREGGGSTPVANPAEVVACLNERNPHIKHWFVPVQNDLVVYTLQELRVDLTNLICKIKLHDDCSLSDEQAIEILSTIIPGLQALIRLQESTLKTVTNA
jgi:hypothetical protein